MDYSDVENDSDGGLIDDLLGPEDLFNDEADEESDAGSGSEKAEEKGEAQEDSKGKGEKKIKQPRIVKNPRIILNFELLNGKNGLRALKKRFKDFKFKGSGHEKEDLINIIENLQQWMCCQLCPSYTFEDCMLQLEALGSHKPVQTLMTKYRLGMDEWGESGLDGKDDVEAEEGVEVAKETDDFDILMNEDITNAEMEAELKKNEITDRQSPPPEPEFVLTQEQLERIERNRKLAEERRLKRMSMQNEQMEVEVQPEKVTDPDLSVGRISLEDNS